MPPKVLSLDDFRRTPAIETYIPEDWDASETRNHAIGLIDRFVKRNELFGPERVVNVSLREREALLRVLAHCKWTLLSRKPDATHPDRKHTILAFRSGKTKHGSEHETLVSPSGSDLDFILMPVDRKNKKSSLHNENLLNTDHKKNSDRLYVTLETGHNIALPLTAQKIKKLKRVRDDLQSAADEVMNRQGFFYTTINPYQQRMQGLATAFDVLIDGIKRRAEAPKPHKSQNKLSPTVRHRNYMRARDEISDHMEVAPAELAHPNRIAAEESREQRKKKSKRVRRAFTKHIKVYDI